MSLDLAHADSSARRGRLEGFTSMLAEDAVYLHTGAPLVQGREAVRAVLAADTAASRRELHWQPLRADLSDDGRLGYTYGVTVLKDPARGEGRLPFGRYISVWRKTDGS